MTKRYEVIADYPDSEHAVGDIIPLAVTDPEDKWQRVMVKKWEATFPKYPHLFKELHWTDKRELNTLPDFVRDNPKTSKYNSVYRVEKWFVEAGEVYARINWLHNKVSAEKLLPATEAEYLKEKEKQ